MKIALSSYTGYGAWFVLRLLAEGHKVDYFLSENKYVDILQGIIPPPKLVKLDYRYNSVPFPKYENYNLSLFDLTGRKRQANYSLDKCPTIGDGIWHCILENERATGIKIMEGAGIEVPPYESFEDINTAKAYIKKTGKRYVFKPDGGQEQDTAATYVSKDAEDLLEYLDKIVDMSGTNFILQEFIPGIEVSVEGWFNGKDFYILNSTLEEKKFMNGGIGPNTGCAGNLVFTLPRESKIYREGLEKMIPTLNSINFRGMIDLNTIVTEDKAYGLEWTPRFGYDASATLTTMYGGNFGEMIHDVATGKVPESNWKSEFGVATRLSIPPYPTEIRLPKTRGVPLKGLDPEDKEAMLKTYLYDVMIEKGKLICAGYTGFMAVPMETGSSIPDAFAKLKSKVKGFQIPDMQYRDDLEKVISKRYSDLYRMGWL